MAPDPRPALRGRGGKAADFPTGRAYNPSIDLRLYSPDFAIVDENEDFLLVDKPPHLMVHPSVPGNPPTLLDGLEALCAYELTCGGQISLINRLDRETSGIVLVAKHRGAARALSKAMERREFRKFYHAIVWGWPEEDEFTIDGPLLRKGEKEPSPIWVKQQVHPDGKASRTRFVVESRFERKSMNGRRFSLLRCFPLTGRMHQIRVHAAFGGHPIVGDKIYGPDEKCYLDFIESGWTESLERILLMSRQALHASGLGWREQEWECPLPPDMSAFAGISSTGKDANLSGAMFGRVL